MNYYIQGDPSRAKEIKAAFENKGFIKEDRSDIYENNVLFFTVDGDKNVHYCWIDQPYCNIVKTHPDYKELELLVEHILKVGDWIVPKSYNGETPRQIVKKLDTVFVLDNGAAYICKDAQKYYRLWTIADAKDGDVLATDNIICIFKKLDKGGYYIISPCIYTVKDGLEVIDDEDDTIGSCGFKPATKEDRELLFRKMKEAGYKWDEKKKELKKITKHYDIANFKPFDKVLVRDHNADAWEVGWYGRYKEDTRHFVGTRWSRQCIPFEGNEHLLGTTDMPSEEFINW